MHRVDEWVASRQIKTNLPLKNVKKYFLGNLNDLLIFELIFILKYDTVKELL